MAMSQVSTVITAVPISTSAAGLVGGRDVVAIAGVPAEVADAVQGVVPGRARSCRTGPAGRARTTTNHCTLSKAPGPAAAATSHQTSSISAERPGDAGDAVADRQRAGHLHHVVDLQMRRKRPSHGRAIRPAAGHGRLAIVLHDGHRVIHSGGAGAASAAARLVCGGFYCALRHSVNCTGSPKEDLACRRLGMLSFSHGRFTLLRPAPPAAGAAPAACCRLSVQASGRQRGGHRNLERPQVSDVRPPRVPRPA